MPRNASQPAAASPRARARAPAREGTLPALSPQPAKKGAPGDNSMNAPDGAVAADVLRSAVRRIHALDADIAALNKRKSDVYQEMKAQGFDGGLVRRVVKEAKVDPLAREEREKLFRLYWEAWRENAELIADDDGEGADGAQEAA